jgi:hypothetical protein
MTETGLLLAQVAFILLLYGFIWLVVRSSSKQVGLPAPRPADREPERELVVPMADPDDGLIDAGEPEIDLLEAHGAPPVMEPAAVPAGVEPSDAETPEDEPALVGAVAEEEPEQAGAFDLSDAFQPRLVVEDSPTLAAGREFDLGGGMTIGRSPSSGVLVSDDFVSHMHARVMRRGHFYFISDLGSTNGTTVNGKRITEERQLRVRDEIQVGTTVLRYEE